MTNEIIFLQPVFKQMIWGGKRLKTDFGYDIPGDDTGECWAISAHPNGDCTVREGEYEGWHLSRLWSEHRELFGDEEGEVFPLLTKIIDARADLSIQVHPDDTYAGEHENGSLGKTEMWYVLDAAKGSEIIYGFREDTDREEVEKALKEKKIDSLLRHVPIEKNQI